MTFASYLANLLGSTAMGLELMKTEVETDAACWEFSDFAVWYEQKESDSDNMVEFRSSNCQNGRNL